MNLCSYWFIIVNPQLNLPYNLYHHPHYIKLDCASTRPNTLIWKYFESDTNAPQKLARIAWTSHTHNIIILGFQREYSHNNVWSKIIQLRSSHINWLSLIDSIRFSATNFKKLKGRTSLTLKFSISGRPSRPPRPWPRPGRPWPGPLPRAWPRPLLRAAAPGRGPAALPSSGLQERERGREGGRERIWERKREMVRK